MQTVLAETVSKLDAENVSLVAQLQAAQANLRLLQDRKLAVQRALVEQHMSELSIARTTLSDTSARHSSATAELETRQANFVAMETEMAEAERARAAAIEAKRLELERRCVIKQWDRPISNPELVYSNGDKTARRPAGASSFPAALAKVNEKDPSSASASSPITLLTVELTAAAARSNNLTFGVAYKGFPAASGNGFGQQRDSWGLHEDRSRSERPDAASRLYKSGDAVKSWRSLKTGDRMQIMVDKEKMQATLKIFARNADPELVHVFDIPPPRSGTSTEMVVGATFADEHELTVVETDAEGNLIAA